MKLMLIACLLLVTSGCTTLLSGQKSASTQSGAFHTALEQLLHDNNPRPLKLFVKNNPNSSNLDEAKLLLQWFESDSKNQDLLSKCNQQLELSQQEIKKLQEDIERLTELNLEMDRSSP